MNVISRKSLIDLIWESNQHLTFGQVQELADVMLSAGAKHNDAMLQVIAGQIRDLAENNIGVGTARAYTLGKEMYDSGRGRADNPFLPSSGGIEFQLYDCFKEGFADAQWASAMDTNIIHNDDDASLENSNPVTDSDMH